MSLNLNSIKWVHVEASSKCNAWCPACPRNKKGYGLVDGLIEQDLGTDQFSAVLEQLPSLHGVQFCGNLGDPIAASNIVNLVELAKSHANKIQVHTNGSLRSTSWWQDFATLLKDVDHDVWFGIDGINETHEIYRQATSFDRVISNAMAFISAGGQATWQFIPFKHNEHQIKDCIKLSQKLGFRKFKIVKSFRKNRTQVRHWRTGEEFLLEPADVYEKKWKIVDRTQVVLNDCMHLQQPSIYLDASGNISPCCYLSGEEKWQDTETMLTELNVADMLTTNPKSTCLKNCGSCATS